MHTEMAVRESVLVMPVLAALVEMLEPVEPEMPVLWKPAAVGWSVATVEVEVRLLAV
jgi:hypothetical protein